MEEHGLLLLVATGGAVVEPLREAGYRVREADFASVTGPDATTPGTQLEEPVAVLVGAQHSPAEVRAVASALSNGGAFAPPVLVTTTGDPAGIEPHLAAGLDVVLPPFTPPLLRTRVQTARELARLSAHRDDLIAEAERARMDKELQIGRDIQQGFLPEHLPQPRGWDVAARFRPAREVAGDFYDAFEMVQGRRVGFVVADVCDKGVGAALFMALIRTLVRHGAQQHVSLSWVDSEPRTAAGDAAGDDWLGGGRSVVRRALPSMGTGSLMNAVAGTNRYMTENHLLQGYFATMFFAMLDPRDGAVSYINGGHNPPVIVRADGTRESLPPTGPAVGMMPDVEFRIRECLLQPGDMLFIYTDGVPEAKNGDGAFFGEERMMQVLREPGTDCAELLDRMDVALRAFVGDAAPFDDITMLAVRRLPES